MASHVPLSRSQRGFKAEEECVAFFLLVRELIHKTKVELKPLYLFFLDLKKAFDSVRHPGIRMARYGGVKSMSWPKPI